MNRLKAALQHPLVWPVLTLVLLILLDLSQNAHFLAITVLDGHWFGAPIDILNRAAPLVLVSLGMTLVIATRGIDISVGAVVAIAGAAAASILADDPSPGHRSACRRARRGRARRHVEWRAGGVRRHAADHRDADPDGGRPRRRAIADGRPDHPDRRAGLSGGRRRLSGAHAVFRVGRGRCDCGDCAAHESHRARHVHPRDRHQSGGDETGRLALERDRVRGLYLLRTDGGDSRHPDQLERAQRRRQQRRPVARTRRDSRRHARWHVAARRQLQPRGHRARRADHPDADLHHVLHRRAA